MSCRAAARRCEVSESTAIKWLERYRREGLRGTGGTRRPSSLGLDAAPGVSRGRPRREVGRHASGAVRPDRVRKGRQRRHLDDEPVLPPDRRHAQKKTLVARERDHAGISRHRTRWRTYQRRIDSARLVFIDETWAKTNMTRLYGWAPRGKRLIDKVPHGHWKTATFLAALRSDRIDAPCLFDGPTNGERFRAAVEQFLVPTLKAGDVVILDNSARTKARPFARRSVTSEPALSSGRPTAPTSARSSRSSPSSKPGCEKSEREPTRPSPPPAPKSSNAFRQANAPPTLETQAMRKAKSKPFQLAERACRGWGAGLPRWPSLLDPMGSAVTRRAGTSSP